MNNLQQFANELETNLKNAYINLNEKEQTVSALFDLHSPENDDYVQNILDTFIDEKQYHLCRTYLLDNVNSQFLITYKKLTELDKVKLSYAVIQQDYQDFHVIITAVTMPQLEI